MTRRRFGRGSLRPLTIGGQPAWEIDYREASGKRVRCIGGRTKAEAQEELIARIRDRDLELHGRGTERGLAMTLPELAEQYLADLATRARVKSVEEARAGLERLSRDLGARTVREVTVPLVMAWRVRRVSGGAANKTVNTEAGYLKAALALAVRLGQLPAHPLAGLRGLPVGGRHQVRRPRALSDWELRRLFQAADELDREAAARAGGRDGPGAPRNHAAVGGQSRATAPGTVAAGAEPRPALRPAPLPRAPLVRALALTGARWGEITSVTWSDLDAQAGTLTLRGETTKNGRARTIPLAAELLEVLLALPAVYARRTGRHPSPGSPIFLSPTGKPWAKGRANFYRHLMDVFARAQIPHTDELGRVVHVHALRHTFITRLARAGVPIATAQLLSGHRTPSVLLAVYTHLRDEESRKAIEALPALEVGGNVDKASDGATGTASSTAAT